mmetsp:Transcript_29384/g.49785  ORF Transcript_29384/g.49785 Transcript_29384/m.49785 type:complete len:359 (+) Transcript_29384:5453-6529(+)
MAFFNPVLVSFLHSLCEGLKALRDVLQHRSRLLQRGVELFCHVSRPCLVKRLRFAYGGRQHLHVHSLCGRLELLLALKARTFMLAGYSSETALFKVLQQRHHNRHLVLHALHIAKLRRRRSSDSGCKTFTDGVPRRRFSTPDRGLKRLPQSKDSSAFVKEIDAVAREKAEFPGLFHQRAQLLASRFLAPLDVPTSRHRAVHCREQLLLLIDVLQHVVRSLDVGIVEAELKRIPLGLCSEVIPHLEGREDHQPVHLPRPGDKHRARALALGRVFAALVAAVNPLDEVGVFVLGALRVHVHSVAHARRLFKQPPVVVKRGLSVFVLELLEGEYQALFFLENDLVRAHLVDLENFVVRERV